MKKSLIYIVAIFSLLACDKSSIQYFDKNVDERINENISDITKTLSKNENGWILTVNSANAGGINHWVKFKDNKRVEMLSDVCTYLPAYSESSQLIKESSYNIKAVQNIVLLFDTYNYIHILSDPEGTVNGGKNGTGLVSDFEFSFFDTDKIHSFYSLKGRYNKTNALLRPCTKEEADSIKNNGLYKNSKAFEDYVKQMKVPAIDVDGKKAEFSLTSHGARIAYLDDHDKVFEAFSGGILGTQALMKINPTSDMALFEPLAFNNQAVSGFRYENGNLCAIIGGGVVAGNVVGGRAVPIYDNKKSVIPLRLGYGQDYSKLDVDPSKLTNTLKDPYLKDYFMSAKNFFAQAYVGYSLEREYFAFIMIDGKPCMQISLIYNFKGSLYSVLWYYEYVINDDKTITFTNRIQKNAGATRFEPLLRVLVDYFCKITYKTYNAYDATKIVIDKVEPRTFRIDWAENNTEGLKDKVGGFYPIDNPECFCVGILKI